MRYPKLTFHQAAWIPAILIGLLGTIFVFDARKDGARLTIKCVQQWQTPQTLRSDVLRRESDECYHEGLRAGEPTLTFIVLGALGYLGGAMAYAAGKGARLNTQTTPDR